MLFVERNTVDFIDPLRNQIELAKHSQYCLGITATQEKGKGEFRGSHFKWSQPGYYQFYAFLQRGVSVKTIDFYLNF